MSAADHLESIMRILKELSDEDIELVEHIYHPKAFGNFQIVLGRGHKQVKLVWDGKESVLTISFTTFKNQNNSVSWVHDADINLPNGEGLYEETWSQSHNMLAI